MKSLAIAFGIACLAAGVLFGVTFAFLTLIGRPDASGVAAASGGLPLMSLAKIAEFVEREQGRKNLATGKHTPVYDFGAFQIAWPLMVVSGTIVLVAVVEVLGFFAGLLGSVQCASQLLAITGLLSAIFGSYFVGRWIGTRSARGGLVATLLVAMIAVTIVIAIDELALSDESYNKILNRERMSYSSILERFIFMLSIYSAFGLVGYWRGTKDKLSKYLHYLLRVLPAGTRDTVVDLAFEEAQKVRSAAAITGPQMPARV